MTKISNKETLKELSILIPQYKDRLKDAEKEYATSKKDGVLTDVTIKHLDNFISTTKETLTKMDRCVELAKNIPEEDPTLKEITSELTGYHKYVLDADIFLLSFLTDQYEALARGR